MDRSQEEDGLITISSSGEEELDSENMKEKVPEEYLRPRRPKEQLPPIKVLTQCLARYKQKVDEIEEREKIKQALQNMNGSILYFYEIKNQGR